MTEKNSVEEILDELNTLLKRISLAIQDFEFSRTGELITQQLFEKIYREATTGEKINYLIDQLEYNFNLLNKKLKEPFEKNVIPLINEKLIKLAGRLNFIEITLFEFDTEEKKYFIEDFNKIRFLRSDLIQKIDKYNKTFPKSNINGMSKSLKLWFKSDNDYKIENIKSFEELKENDILRC